MSWRRGTRAVGSAGVGCLIDFLMYTCVTPGLVVLLVLAWYVGGPLWLVGSILFALLVFALYLLATWDD
jgi:hypothetical protein